MKSKGFKRLDKTGVYELAITLIYLAIKSNETEFLSCSDYGSGLLDFAEERSGYSFEQMKKMVKASFSTKNLDIEIFKEEAKIKSLSELAEQYNCSQQLLRSYCINHQIDFLKQRETNNRKANEELISKLKSYNGRYSIYEMSQMTHRCTTTIKALCKVYNIPSRVA